jgi:pyruvate/2-oxoglutarate dehydrogenase complex dihydrolipoamide acyltransferase (E2) component
MLRIELPLLSADMMTGRIDQWHKDVGDEVVYGDELLDVVVEDVTRVTRSHSARSSVFKRRRRAHYRNLSGKRVRFRILSLDAGYVSTIDAKVNSKVEAGALLAVLIPNGALAAEEAPFSLARVAVIRRDLEDPEIES